MSELIKTQSARKSFRWHLLASVSALVLAGSAIGQAAEADEDQSRPSIWIELGGQLERQTGQGDFPVQPFITDYANSAAFNPVSPLDIERAPHNSNGLEGKISFEPAGTDWVFSAGVRYGRSGTNRDVHRGKEYVKQAHFTRYPRYYYTPSGTLKFHLPVTGNRTFSSYVFGGTEIKQSQSHTIVDFMAGKDVGLGMLGRGGSSTLNFGVRFAQFVSKANSAIHARPDVLFYTPCNSAAAAYYAHVFPSHDFKFCFPRTPNFHTFAASVHSYRKFHGIGPTISWNASAPILGNPDREVLTVDWGINASVLFGRQSANGSHQTTGIYKGYGGGVPFQYTRTATFDRARKLVVPNVGGMIGASLKFPNAKISLGYRGDFFFGAMDTGVDERKTKTVGFYGPFATISFGFGG